MNWQIAIDGPAGAGKSTIAQEVAKKLNFAYVDTGAMYRAVTLKALRLNIDLDNPNDYDFLHTTTIDFVNNHIYLDGVDVSQDIRTVDVTQNVSAVSRIRSVRDKLVALQQRFVASKNIIMDGRDIGTVVLPHANLKIYLEATIEERARRRMKEREAQGMNALSFDETLKEITERDYKDTHREISPLSKAEDAVEIDTSLLNVSQVVEKIISLVWERGYKMENAKTETIIEETKNSNKEEVLQEETTATSEAPVEETPIVEEQEDDAIEDDLEDASDDEETVDLDDAEEEVVTTDEATEENLVRELQLVQGRVKKIFRASEPIIKNNEVKRKAKQERVLIELENGQEGFLFRKDTADIEADEEFVDFFMEGDTLPVVVKRIYPDGGKVLLSTVLVKKRDDIKRFEEVITNHGIIKAKVIKVIKVGLILEHDNITCLLPNTQINMASEHFNELIGEELEVAPIRVDYNRIRLIVSHSVASAIKARAEKQNFIKDLEVGQVFKGVVKNIERYGAFVEISEGIEGLLHISEIEHNRILKVEKVLNVGDTVEVQVIKIDEKDHIGLSRKALLPNYWKDFFETHKVDDKVTGKVIEINRAGVVLALNEQIQAFLPKSEFAWEKDTFIEDFTHVGADLEAKIIELDINKKRIILSRKQLQANPWETLRLKAGDLAKAIVVKTMNEGTKITIQGASGFLPKGNYAVAASFTPGDEIEVKVKVFDANRTRLIVSQKEDYEFDKTTVNKFLKSQERSTSTLGELLDLEGFETTKK